MFLELPAFSTRRPETQRFIPQYGREIAQFIASMERCRKVAENFSPLQKSGFVFILNFLEGCEFVF
jgi:hypothetical protein